MKGIVTIGIVFLYAFSLLILIVLITFLVLSDIQTLQHILGVQNLLKTVKLENLDSVFQTYMNTTVTLIETRTELEVPETILVNKGNLTIDHFSDAFTHFIAAD